jgi:hypothetical protein
MEKRSLMVSINLFQRTIGALRCQQLDCDSLKKSRATLDTILALWLNTNYAGANSHPGSSNACLRADSPSLVLLTPAFSLAQSIVGFAH